MIGVLKNFHLKKNEQYSIKKCYKKEYISYSHPNNSHPSSTSDLVGTTTVECMHHKYCSKKSSSTVHSPGTCCSGDAGPVSIWLEVCMLSIP